MTFGYFFYYNVYWYIIKYNVHLTEQNFEHLQPVKISFLLSLPSKRKLAPQIGFNKFFIVCLMKSVKLIPPMSISTLMSNSI